MTLSAEVALHAERGEGQDADKTEEQERREAEHGDVGRAESGGDPIVGRAVGERPQAGWGAQVYEHAVRWLFAASR